MKRTDKKAQGNKYFKKFLIMMGVVFVTAFMIVGLAIVMIQPQPLENQLAKDLGLDITQATHVKNIMKEVGIEEYTSIIHDEGLDNAHKLGEKGYRMSAMGEKNIILYVTPDAKFVKVKFADKVLFASGSTSTSILGMVFTDKEKADYKTMTELTVKGILRSPSTADFPLLDGWKFGKIDGEVVVQGYVDAENALGAVVRSDFQAKYKAGAVISLIFDGKEYVNY